MNKFVLWRDDKYRIVAELLASKRDIIDERQMEYMALHFEIADEDSLGKKFYDPVEDIDLETKASILSEYATQMAINKYMK